MYFKFDVVFVEFFKGFDIFFIDGNGVVYLCFILMIGYIVNVYGSDFYVVFNDVFDVGRIGKQKYYVFVGVFWVIVDVNYFCDVNYMCCNVWWCNLCQQCFMNGICCYFIVYNNNMVDIGFFGLVGSDLIVNEVVINMGKFDNYIIIWVYWFCWCGCFWCGCDWCWCGFFYWFCFQCFYVFMIGFYCQCDQFVKVWIVVMSYKCFDQYWDVDVGNNFIVFFIDDNVVGSIKWIVFLCINEKQYVFIGIEFS